MELKELFEPIINFIKGLQNRDKDNSKDEAKKRLQLVLMQDRASVSPDFFEMMKKEIIDVIKKYIEIDEEALEVQLTRGFEDGVTGPALFANIPIKNIKPIAKKFENVGDSTHDDTKTDVENASDGAHDDSKTDEQTVGNGAHDDPKTDEQTVGVDVHDDQKTDDQTVGVDVYDDQKTDDQTVGVGAHDDQKTDDQTVGVGTHDDSKTDEQTVGVGTHDDPKINQAKQKTQSSTKKTKGKTKK